jgi:FkbM family methyltransferase
MNEVQSTILWSRQLWTELGLSGIGTTPGELGAAACQRHGAIIDLLMALTTELEIELFMEIGAHEAGASKHFVWLNQQARAIAYEPSPAVFEKTVGSGIPDRMEIFKCAIGSYNGEIEFFQPVDESLRPMGSTRKRMAQVDGKDMEIEVVKASIITLEEAARRAAPAEGRRTAMWVDVEGQALEVLSSGRDFIEKHVAVIYVEIQDVNSYEGSATSIEVLQLLLSIGFVPVVRDNQHGDAYNLLAVHQSAYLHSRERLTYWFRANSGITTVSNWVTGGKLGTPTI